jgi:transposase InsO family protein
MTRDIVIDALRMAWFKHHPSKISELMFHSDRGSQYASNDFRDVLKEYGITASMSRRGDCWDNACSETLFGSLKVERPYGHVGGHYCAMCSSTQTHRDLPADQAP